jgi:cation diffusion facilitator family transporter
MGGTGGGGGAGDHEHHQSSPDADHHHGSPDHGSHHDHGHDDHGSHDHPAGLRGALTAIIRPHSHDHSDSLDQELLASREGVRALWVSLVGLLATAAIQAVIVAASHSVGLLADTIHNLADALTAVPIGLAFLIGRRRPTRRYTYGFGRAEDLAGLTVVLVIALSVVVAAWEAIARLIHPQSVGHLWAVAAGGLIGFAGNELAARYRTSVGRRIGSAALVADGQHARADGFTSLAVVAGAVGVAAGWPSADAVVGLLISAAIAVVLWGAARDVFRRLMDATDPETVEQVRRHALEVQGVEGVDQVRVRWVGHELHATVELSVPSTMSIGEAHQVAEVVHHQLLHEVPRLVDVTIHTNPAEGQAGAGPSGGDAHALTAHHRARRRGRGRPGEPH